MLLFLAPAVSYNMYAPVMYECILWYGYESSSNSNCCWVAVIVVTGKILYFVSIPTNISILLLFLYAHFIMYWTGPDPGYMQRCCPHPFRPFEMKISHFIRLKRGFSYFWQPKMTRMMFGCFCSLNPAGIEIPKNISVFSLINDIMLYPRTKF